MKVNYVHGFEYPISKDLTLCGFRASLLNTHTKGMNCSRCWDRFKEIKRLKAEGKPYER